MKRRAGLRKRRKGTAKHRAWDAFSIYIRTRDADENGIAACISCGKPDHWKNLHAGHYVPASVSLTLRFHEKNVHVQCPGCNTFKHGNLTQYALALKKRYGEMILDDLETIRRLGEGKRISEPEYREMIEKYQAKVSE